MHHQRRLQVETSRLLIRPFYSGLSDARTQRLRRSGMTFNKPRGRDLLSRAFESRIRLAPMEDMHTLYQETTLAAVVERGEAPPPNPLDPTSSVGNPIRMRHAAEGDVRSVSMVGQRQAEEATAFQPHRTWRVGVAALFPSAGVSFSVPSLRASWTAMKVGDVSLGAFASVSETEGVGMSQELSANCQQIGGRSTITIPSPTICFPQAHPHFYAMWPKSNEADHCESSCVSSFSGLQPVSLSIPSAEGESAEENGESVIQLHLLGTPQRRDLQRSGDATQFPLCLARGVKSERAGGLHTFHLIPVLEPWIEVPEFGREEVQVEMIATYRNILLECAELQLPSDPLSADQLSASESKGFRFLPTDQKRCGAVDVLRVPALCLDQWQHEQGPSRSQWAHEIGKLNQQALIKAFHRLPVELKEKLLQNPIFTVELYVPPVLLPVFTQAFLEEAWETPDSTLRPARTALYPGLAPPPSLLSLDGWVGKREELKEAVATKGRSLLSGPTYQLSGEPVVEKEVWTEIRVFGSREEEAKRLARERETAKGEENDQQ